MARFDFTRELKIVEDLARELQQKLVATPFGTPSNCPCHRTERQHLADKIDALDALWVFLAQDNFVPLSILLEQGPGAAVFAASLVYPDQQEAQAFMAKLIDSVHQPGSPSPLNGFGRAN